MTQPPGGEQPARIELVRFRPSFWRAAAAVGSCLVVVGFALFPAFALGTPLGRWRLGEEGVLVLFAGWAVMVVAVSAAALTGPALLRGVSTGLRQSTRRGVVQLAAFEAVLCAAPATLMSFLVAGGVDDIMRVLATTFFMTGVFSFAVLLPMYRRGWDDANQATGPGPRAPGDVE